jgi:putative DNA primase/helicase
MEREQSERQRRNMDVHRVEALFNQGYLESLQPYPHWVVWTLLEDKHGDLKKVPFNPRTHKAASSTNLRTWDTLPVALSALKGGRFAGLGFVFSESAPFTGIDFDHCIEHGKLKPDVEEVIEELDSYSEYSPSRSGIHVIVKGRLPGRNIKRPHIELYDKERFFTITLHHLAGAPIDAKESSYLPTLYEQSSTPKPTPVFLYPSEGMKPRYSDEKVLEKAMSNVRMGETFRRHFMGDESLWTGKGPMHHSQSEAVWQLVLYLKFYTYGNAEQMDRLFRQSKLYEVSKWDENRGDSTYGAETIRKALSERK